MRILVVTMAESVHAARWTQQITGLGWDVHLFPAYEAALHPAFRNITLYDFSSRRPRDLHSSIRLRGLWPLNSGSHLIPAAVQSLSSALAARARWLALLIRWLKPDVVHSMEIQHAAYLTLAARQILSRWFPRWGFPAWIVSNWGSDIYLFGRLPEHAGRIREVLSACDYYHCECERDVALGRAFGFSGTVLPVLPAGGGFDLEEMAQLRRPGPASARRRIALKGYQSWAGRALVGLRAIERCADALEGYRVGMYLVHPPEIRAAAERVSRSTGIAFDIEPYPYAWPREKVLRLLGHARLAIGLSISDAISTSMLEAMIMGALPVQSHTGCQDEWVRDGETALSVPPEDPDAIELALRRALADDALVDSAAEANRCLAAMRLDERIIRPQVVALYQQVAAKSAVV
jgi:glycosyltransferase involved in cell wall biosynthesis